MHTKCLAKENVNVNEVKTRKKKTVSLATDDVFRVGSAGGKLFL